MDEYYQNYKSDNDFFILEDFIFYCGQTMGDYYRQEYDRMRAEMRQEKKDELISFSADALSTQDIALKWSAGILSATLTSPYMAFPYDDWNIGIQDIVPSQTVVSMAGIFKRTTLSGIFKLKHLPIDNKIYWYATGPLNINFYKNGNCNVPKATVYYVPVPDANTNVPAGILEYVTTNTMSVMRQAAQGAIVKKSLDRNQNKAAELEANIKK